MRELNASPPDQPSEEVLKGEIVKDFFGRDTLSRLAELQLEGRHPRYATIDVEGEVVDYGTPLGALDPTVDGQ